MFSKILFRLKKRQLKIKKILFEPSLFRYELSIKGVIKIKKEKPINRGITDEKRFF